MFLNDFLLFHLCLIGFVCFLLHFISFVCFEADLNVLLEKLLEIIGYDFVSRV